MTLFYIDELKRLREIVDARLLLLASQREQLALRVDTGEEIKILSRLTQKILAQSEIQTRAILPITDHAAIVDLGFHPEPDLGSDVFSILISTRGSEDFAGRRSYRWALVYFRGKKKTAEFYCYETTSEAWEQLDGDPEDMKVCATGLRTIGDLEKALDVASDFGRIDIRKELEYLDEQLERDETDETPLSSEESDLSGTLKDFSSDPVVDVDDQISF